MNRTDKEIELQSRLRADDKDALETVYLAYREEFVNFSKRYKVVGHDALDIFQDSVIVLHQKFVSSQLVLESSSVKTYLFAIGKNKILKQKNLWSNTISLLMLKAKINYLSWKFYTGHCQDSTCNHKLLKV